MNDCIVYGIPNCDSVKKTINWLNENNISFTFHNYKKDGIDKETLKQWSSQVGWEQIFNKKGTTWKKIALDYEGIKITESKAIQIMLEQNSIIKRPIVVTSKGISVGVDFERLQTIL